MDDAEEQSALIPTGFDAGSYTSVRSLAAEGVNPVVASEYTDVPAAASRFCEEFVRIPSPHEDLVAYRDALLGIAARPDVKTVLPLRPQDPYVFAKYADEFEPYVSLVTPPMETLRTVQDRLKLVETAEAAGVPAPETRLLSEVDDWGEQRIVKSRYNLLVDEYLPSLSPRDVLTVKSIEHVEAGDRPDVEAIQESMQHDPIVQEFVDSSDEYLFGALYDHGEALTTFQHRQVRGDSYRGGGGVYRESIDDPELEAVGRKLLDHMDYHGLACIEYMKDAETGEYVLTEINPRLWQSLPLAVEAGADFPLDYWYLATDQAELIEDGYETGVGSHLLYGEFQHLLSVVSDDSPIVDRPSVAGTVGTIASSCLQTPNFDVLKFDDPMPFLQGIGHFVRKRT
ncbi:carboxylate--amine ligase [Natronomonas salina]|uniref:carboxylate--amine ligase n=1 Tax=Natronomonas salina TaxID=1710540 RepID=UPI0015B37F43|nr:carboxylate--amine ligase [Natronomonas salina]QLD88702.1 carboxylate--amine ligase [Natronomonas salina]